MTASPKPLRLLALALLCAGVTRVEAVPLAAHLASLRAEEAAALLPAAASPLVAVLDTGFEIDHPALRSKLVGGYNAFTGGSEVGLDPLDALLYTHGTAVAGIISAKASLTVWPRAVYPTARILPIKVCCTIESGGTMTNSHLLRQGILYAAGIPNDDGHAAPERARVINISYVLSDEYDPTLLDAIDQATRAGSLVVTAVGEGTPQISPYLAQLAGVIGVMTAANAESRPLLDLPIPVIPAPGTNIPTLLPAGTTLAPVPSSQSVSGSSFATAVTSAIAAMLVAQNPNLSPADMATILSSDSIYDAQGLDAVLAVQKADELPLPATGANGDAAGGTGGGAMDALALVLLLALGRRRRPP